VIGTRKRCTGTNNNVPGTSTKKVKKVVDHVVQQQVFILLLFCCSLNGGKFKHGDIQDVLDAYEAMGYTVVACNNLWYRLELVDQKGQMTMSTERVPPKEQVVVGPQTGVSPLTPNW
jgi:hypothetical protein